MTSRDDDATTKKKTRIAPLVAALGTLGLYE